MDLWHLIHQKLCIITSMKKINSIHQFIPEIQQILKYHGLKYHAHICSCQQKKNTKVIFSFPTFVLACKKSAQFINSFLEYSRFYNPIT